jgi:hypothetical protein
VPPTITVFLFVKGTAAHPIEKMIVDAQCAAALDTLERIQPIKEIGKIVVATDDSKFAVRAARLGALVERDPKDHNFHWGKRLASLVEKYHPAIPFYIGGGSGVLMGTPDWYEVVKTVLNEQPIVVTNNFFSCDFAAWSPGDALARIQMPDLDNNLAFRLGEQAGLKFYPLPKNAATQLDIDTPTDLMTLYPHPGVGEHLRKFLKTIELDLSRVQRVKSFFKRRDATLLIAGRVSGSMANLLERATQCQWRVYSEERGMRASGREERNEVRSLLGFHLEQLGAKDFMRMLSQIANAAILDTRVLFAHQRLKPTANDRFYSDLLQPDKIADPFVRDLTAAARGASIPIILGGHSLVAGGMYAMIETSVVV